MLMKVKNTLRIKNTAFDDEILDLINAAKSDLELSGVSSSKAEDESDPLIIRAINIYCKMTYADTPQEAQILQDSYNSLKIHLSLAGDYNAVD